MQSVKRPVSRGIITEQPHSHSVGSPLVFGFCFLSVGMSGECSLFFLSSDASSSVAKMELTGISTDSDEDDIMSES